MGGGRRQLPFSSLMALDAPTAPRHLGPKGCRHQCEARTWGQGQALLHCSDLQGSLWIRQCHSSLQPGWGSPGPKLQGGDGPKYLEALGEREEGAARAGGRQERGTNYP